MPIVNGPQARQRVQVGIGARFSGGSQIGPRHDPAQALAPIATLGGNLPLLWTAEDGVFTETFATVDGWRTRNVIPYAPGAPRIDDLVGTFVIAENGNHRPTLLTPSGQEPLRALADPGVIGAGPVTYLESDPGESTGMSMAIPAGFVLTADGTVSGKDTITGMLLARAVDMDGDANVLRVVNSFTGEDFKIRSNAAGDAWILDSDGTGHAHTIGGSGTTPMTGDWQWVRFGYRSTDQHYLRVGTRSEVTASGTSGYDWSSDEEEVTTISLFPVNADDEVQIAAAFFCFGDDPTGGGEAAIARWVNHHYPNIVSN
jgi:hypothetical protein